MHNFNIYEQQEEEP